MAAVYMLAGSLFAIFFLSKGIGKVDITARGSGWGFRLMILPGTIVFWPVLLKKCLPERTGRDKSKKERS
jgi:hypothetical protein